MLEGTQKITVGTVLNHAHVAREKRCVVRAQLYVKCGVLSTRPSVARESQLPVTETP